MKRPSVVLLDACVLIPMPLADTLLRLAAGPRLFLPKWSDDIMAEVSRSLQEDFGLSAEKTLYRETQIRRHFQEAWVEGYEDLIPGMTNHFKDRHVLAAAVQADAKVIVTYNIKDFPHSSLAPYSITTQGPSAFLKKLYDQAPSAMMDTLESQAAAIGKPLQYLLSRLRINAPAFVAMLNETHGESFGRNKI
ncbi:PIN domain-containing protein [Telmatobacter bradus]|uniref:PIN domain-containing protein n=1 Tax=Telmatobacter bradus TaxID=474953 RepID=UPI003B4339DE